MFAFRLICMHVCGAQLLPTPQIVLLLLDTTNTTTNDAVLFALVGAGVVVSCLKQRG